MDINREFELYRKLEIMLFRYFKIAQFLENSLKIVIKTKDPISTILNPIGYDNSYTRGMKQFNETIYIPFNPFYLNEDEKQIFLQIFPNEFWNIENDEKSIRKVLIEMWKRIYEIKKWFGVNQPYNRDCQTFTGIRRESKLTTSLQDYLKTNIANFRWDFEYAIFRNVSKDTIIKFLNILRRNRKGIISIR